MPIEIKELHIRIAVNTDQSSGRSAGPGTVGSGVRLSAAAQQAVVAECVEQVVRILQEKRER